MTENQAYIKTHVDTRELLEQLAEESAELCMASLKLIRALGLSNNPTPIDIQTAVEHIREETEDALLCITLLSEYTGIDTEEPIGKEERWADRLKMINKS